MLKTLLPISTLNALGIAFVVLKLCAVIDWSWLWVTAPFWALPVFALSIFLAVLLLAGVVLLIGAVVTGMISLVIYLRKRWRPRTPTP